MGFFHKSLDKIKAAFKKTAEVLNTDVRTLFVPGRQIDDVFLLEMEEKFLQADMGVKNVESVVTEVRDRWRLGKIKNAEDAERVVKEQMVQGWGSADSRELHFAESGPTVILVAGINGAGKTTSIAKLAWLLKNEMKKKVMVCASDTFSASRNRASSPPEATFISGPGREPGLVSTMNSTRSNPSGETSLSSLAISAANRARSSFSGGSSAFTARPRSSAALRRASESASAARA